MILELTNEEAVALWHKLLLKEEAVPDEFAKLVIGIIPKLVKECKGNGFELKLVTKESFGKK